MKKIIFKTIVMLGIVFAGLSYLYVVKTGRPATDLINPSAVMTKGRGSVIKTVSAPKTLLNAESKSGSLNSKGKKTQIYKWRDADGILHYTNTPPPDDVAAEMIKVDPNMNSIAGVKSAEPVQPAAEEVATAPADDTPNINPYSPDSIKEMMSKAKGLQDQLDKRAQQQQQAINQ